MSLTSISAVIGRDPLCLGPLDTCLASRVPWIVAKSLAEHAAHRTGITMNIHKQVVALCLTASMAMGAFGAQWSLAAGANSGGVNGSVSGGSVNGNSPKKLMPTIASFTPTASLALKSVVTVTGTNFGAGTTLALVQGTRLTRTPATLAANGTSLTFTPTAGTAVGLYNIRVTNAAGSVTTLSNLRVTL